MPKMDQKYFNLNFHEKNWKNVARKKITNCLKIQFSEKNKKIVDLNFRAKNCQFTIFVDSVSSQNHDFLR